MATKLISENKQVNDFLQMGHLLSVLESRVKKEDKILAIKSARASGFLTDDEALELAIEFC